MMLFKPSAVRVAIDIYKKSPSVAGTITALVSDDFPALSDHIGENHVLNAILIDITAESMIRGIAVARGEQFSYKVANEYNKISPSFGVLAELCAEALASGMSQEQRMAELVISKSEYNDISSIAGRLEEFITTFRSKALDVVSRSL